jgi:hypothetical protein
LKKRGKGTLSIESSACWINEGAYRVVCAAGSRARRPEKNGILPRATLRSLRDLRFVRRRTASSYRGSILPPACACCASAGRSFPLSVVKVPEGVAWPVCDSRVSTSFAWTAARHRGVVREVPAPASRRCGGIGRKELFCSLKGGARSSTIDECDTVWVV